MAVPFNISRYIFVTQKCLKLRRAIHCSASIQHEYTTTETNRLSIPLKIERSPTAVLEAIAATVDKDPLAPNFKYIDDPALIPISVNQKRMFALARSSGKKAAKWVLQRYQKDLRLNPAEPSIEAFMPKNDTFRILRDKPNELGLIEMIDNRLVADAWDLYQKMKSEGTEISPETYTALLDLLCAYNSEDPSEEMTADEQWFWRDLGQDNTKKLKNTWKTDGLAQKMFDEMPEKNSAAYRSMIRGMSKYLNVDGVYDLYCKMCDEKMETDIKTLNAVLNIAPFVKEDNEMMWSLIQDVLNIMKENEIAPNLDTFNMVLAGLSRMSIWRNSNITALQVINEMKALGIEPSLGSWHYVISIFYKHNYSQSRILYEIMDHLKGKHFELRHPSDTEFFRTAMLKACINLKDPELAHKIDDFLNTGRNCQLIGDGFKESTFFSYYLNLICSIEPIDEIMKLYDRAVPHSWTPGFNLMKDIVAAIELQDGFQYLPQIWNDCVLFNFFRYNDVIEEVFRVMGKKKHNKELQENFNAVTLNVIEILRDIEESKEMGRKFPKTMVLRLSSHMISSLINVCVHSENLETAWNFYYEKYLADERSFGRPLNEDSILLLTNFCISLNEKEKSLKLIEQARKNEHPELESMIKSALEKLELDNDERSLLSPES